MNLNKAKRILDNAKCYEFWWTKYLVVLPILYKTGCNIVVVCENHIDRPIRSTPYSSRSVLSVLTKGARYSVRILGRWMSLKGFFSSIRTENREFSCGVRVSRGNSCRRLVQVHWTHVHGNGNLAPTPIGILPECVPLRTLIISSTSHFFRHSLSPSNTHTHTRTHTQTHTHSLSPSESAHSLHHLWRFIRPMHSMLILLVLIRCSRHFAG